MSLDSPGFHSVSVEVALRLPEDRANGSRRASRGHIVTLGVQVIMAIPERQPPPPGGYPIVDDCVDSPQAHAYCALARCPHRARSRTIDLPVETTRGQHFRFWDTMSALDAMKENGIISATFGAGAMSELTPGYNLKGVRVKMLKQTYNSIVPKLGVTGKSEFRQKLGAEEDPLHVCYPKHGMGASGTKAIMDFLQSEG